MIQGQHTKIGCMFYSSKFNMKTKFLKYRFQQHKNMKHLEINLTKFVQALYTKNYKTWLKELKKTYQ